MMTASAPRCLDTAVRSLAVTLLIVNNASAAFVPHGPNPLAPWKAQPSCYLSRGTAAQRVTTTTTSTTAGNLRRSVMALEVQGTPLWRYQVDDFFKAISPWGSSVEAEIIATDLLKQLPEVAKDVTDAVRRGTLLPEVVLAEGTEARFTVEGLRAVSRQLQQDILPEALEAAPRIAKAAASSPPSAPSPMGTKTKGGTRTDAFGARASTSRRDSRTGPLEGVSETLYAVRNAARDLSPRKVREGIRTAASEVENVVSRKPRGLYSPDYSVEDAREGFEVRRYASYAVCSAPMTDGAVAAEEEALDEGGLVATTAGSGEGFNTLAGYLFGNNTQERAMDMTTPVNIDVSPAGGRTMSFVMPKDIPAGKAPTPRDPRIGVADVADGELLAVREFPGFATDGEVKRQLESLLGALDREATRPWRQLGSDAVAETTQTAEAERPTSESSWRAEDPSGRSYRLMQYNPPYTLPWLRTNSVAVKVVEVADSGISGAVSSGSNTGAVSSSSNTGAISRTTGASESMTVTADVTDRSGKK